MMAATVLHMLAMAVVHWRTKYTPPRWPRRRVFYQCIINGISNLYLHNDIVAVKGDDTKSGVRDTKLLIVNVVIVIENIVIVTIAFFHPDNIGLPPGLLGAVIGVHTAGLLLLVLYYQQLHIWSSLIPLRLPLKRAK